MGLKGFLLSSSFIDGGVTGVSMLLATTTGVSLSLLLPIVNLPFVASATGRSGSRSRYGASLGIAGLALALAFDSVSRCHADLVLTAVFGGFFIGAGIGLAVRGGAVLDGTEIAALLISRRADLLKVGDVILGFNVVLFVIAMSILGVEPALYSILTYVTAARTLDFVLHGIDEYTAITIVSDLHTRRSASGSHAELGRGVTVFKGYGGMSGAERDILYCVVTRLEISNVKAIVQRGRRRRRSSFSTRWPAPKAGWSRRARFTNS